MELTVEFQKLLNESGNVPITNQTLRHSFERGFLPRYTKLISGDEEVKKYLGGVLTHGLSIEQAFVIHSYSVCGYEFNNRPLRSGIASGKIELIFNSFLDSALNQIPNYNNEVVYRMEYPQGEKSADLEWYSKKVGININLPFYLSTSKDNWDNRPIIWRIKTLVTDSKARDISNITNNPPEKEVLFKRGSKFKIIEVKDNIIDMEELPENAKTHFDLVGSFHLNH